jgi:hypothetical protein
MAIKKRPYQKSTIVRNLDTDFGLGADIDIEFWRDPSREIALGLIEILVIRHQYDELPEDQLQEFDDKYWHYASEVFIDSSVEGVSFDTPEECEKAFDNPDLPWGIFHMAMIMYIAWLTENNVNLKNVLRRLAEASASGDDNKEEETSGQTKT